MKTNPQQLIQAYQQAPWRVQLQVIGIFSLGVVLAGVVAGIYLNVSARTATVGREIQVLQREILNLQRINADGETQLAQLTAVGTMEQRARDLGFRPVSADQLLYLPIRGYSGRPEARLADPPGLVLSQEPDLPPEFTQSLLDWVRDVTLHPEGLERAFGMQTEVGAGGLSPTADVPESAPAAKPGGDQP